MYIYIYITFELVFFFILFVTVLPESLSYWYASRLSSIPMHRRSLASSLHGGLPVTPCLDRICTA